MGLFGPSRKEKFVRSDAGNLANYLKNNAVKMGGETYAKCQTLGILSTQIDKPLVWYFWSVVYAFRVAQDTLILKNQIDNQTLEILFEAFIEADNKYFRVVEHTPYEETFASVNIALDLIKANNTSPPFEQAAIFMLHATKAIPGLTDRDQRYTVVQALSEAAIGFPSLKTIINQNA